MTDWGWIHDLADTSTAASAYDEVLVAYSSANGPADVLTYLQDWFGEDEARSRVRIIVDNDDKGVLSRTSLYELSASTERGGLGSADYATVPGDSTDFVPLHLIDSTAGCTVRVTAVSFDPDDPPRCPLHHTLLAPES